jgi:hypothetical protein
MSEDDLKAVIAFNGSLANESESQRKEIPPHNGAIGGLGVKKNRSPTAPLGGDNNGAEPVVDLKAAIALVDLKAAIAPKESLANALESQRKENSPHNGAIGGLGVKKNRRPKAPLGEDNNGAEPSNKKEKKRVIISSQGSKKKKRKGVTSSKTKQGDSIVRVGFNGTDLTKRALSKLIEKVTTGLPEDLTLCGDNNFPKECLGEEPPDEIYRTNFQCLTMYLLILGNSDLEKSSGKRVLDRIFHRELAKLIPELRSNVPAVIEQLYKNTKLFQFEILQSFIDMNAKSIAEDNAVWQTNFGTDLSNEVKKNKIAVEPPALKKGKPNNAVTPKKKTKDSVKNRSSPRLDKTVPTQMSHLNVPIGEGRKIPKKRLRRRKDL